MSFYFPNVDPTYLFKRDEGSYLFLQDRNTVSSSKIMLKEIPEYENRVKATVVGGDELVEVDINEPNISPNEFRVDYSVGIVHFHPSLEGQDVISEYYGMGMLNISPSRILMESGSDDPTETLQEVLDRVDEGINVLEEVGDLSFRGVYSSEIQYRKWNFVSHDNKTYVAVEDVRGENPQSSDKWVLVSSGVAWVGVYNENDTYSIGDMVADSESHNLYMSEIDNNTSPLSDTNNWSVMMSVDGLVNRVDNRISVLDEQFDTKMADLTTTIDTKTNEFDTQISTNIEDMDNFINTKSQELVDLMDYTEDEESTRVSNESTRQSNEQQRVDNEDERQDAHQLRGVEHANALDELNIVTQNAEAVITETEHARDNAQEQANNVLDVLPRIEGFEHMGEYNPDTQYRKNNLVTYNGSTYQAIQDAQNISPISRDYWVLVAQKGMDGTGLISTIEGRLPDKNGNIELNGLTVTSVNGQVGDVTIDLNTLQAETPDGAQAKVDLHAGQTDNPHRVSKGQVGLGNVIDERQATKEEFDEFADRTNDNIGNLYQLDTMDQESLVTAINELYAEIERLKGKVEDLENQDGTQ